MAGPNPPQVLRGIGLAIAAIELPRQRLPLLHTLHPGLHLFRGALLMLTSILAFLSLKHMPAGEFTAIVLLTLLVAGGGGSAGALSAVCKIYRPK